MALATPPRPWPPRIIGHRGAAALAPENTLAALNAAAESGAPWVEIDVTLTRDQVPVLLHDPTLERTSTATGSIAERDFVDLQSVDAGTWFSPRFAREGVPSLSLAIETAIARALGLVVEIKPTADREIATARGALAILREAWPPDWPAPVITSFSETALETAQSRAPQWPRALITSDWPKALATQRDGLGLSGVHVAANAVTPGRIKQARDLDLWVVAWTVNDPAEAMRLLDQGVDSVITDDPRLLRPTGM